MAASELTPTWLRGLVAVWRNPPRRPPRWMLGLAALLSASLLGLGGLMSAWTLGYLGSLRFHHLAVPAVQLVPAPVGGHPSGDQPWFLVVGDSIGAGIDPAALGGGPNRSWVALLAQQLARSGHAWRPDDLACPEETTESYSTGCPLAFTNPLLGGRPQRQAALDDIRAHRSTLRLIVVELGANDLFGMGTDYAVQVRAEMGRLQGIVAELERSAPGVPMFLADVYDPYAADAETHAAEIGYFDRGVRLLALQEGAHLIDFADAIVPGGVTTRLRLCRLVDCAHDGIHPTPVGDGALAAAAQRAIKASGILVPATG